MAIVGIDLGTTNSLVAYWNGKQPELIPNALGEYLTPSVVSIDSDGSVLVGKVASERLITHPQVTASQFKRRMGSEAETKLANHTFRPEELSALVLRALIADAEEFLQEPVQEAIVSVPAYFNDIQRRATKQAGQLAGANVQRVINEPTAAALFYGHQTQSKEGTYLVFDLGGGTFDVSIVEVFDQVMEVHVSTGDNYLGGNDFTEILFSDVLGRNKLSLDSISLTERASITRAVEAAKLALTRETLATVSFSVGEKQYSTELSRASYEHSVEKLTARLRKPLERALRDSRLSPSQLDAVILVGGASRMPVVRSLVAKLFGKLPYVGVDPDQVVALGAAVQAGLKSRDLALAEHVLTDVCPYTLGTEVVKERGNSYSEGHFSPIIERNTVIPVSKVERFYAVSKDQGQILINVFQGESRSIKNNIFLGAISIDIPKAETEERAVDVRFTYDINGMLEVLVKSIATGETKTLVLTTSANALSEEEIRASLRKLESLKIHPRDQLENRTILARAERLYEESLGEIRGQVQEEIVKFEEILDQQDQIAIRKARVLFQRVLDSFESGQLL